MTKFIKFLKSVILASLASYGGPEAHIGAFVQRFVVKDKYLTENELIELVGLYSLVPGPTSTQTITSIGYLVGGPLLALFTFLVWATPAILIMTVVSFLTLLINDQPNLSGLLQFIAPMAVGFILIASYRIGRKVIVSKETLLIFLTSFIITLFLRQWYVFPIILIISGLITSQLTKEKSKINFKISKPPYIYLLILTLLPTVVIIFNLIIPIQTLDLFIKFYRYGILVFGGGQVVVPLMYNELVTELQLLTSTQFLSGYGIVQGIPGPLFSFASYAGALANQSNPIIQFINGIISGFALFLPGLILVFFVMPIYKDLRNIQFYKNALVGVSASAGGLIASAGVILLIANGLSLISIFITALTSVLLYNKKIPESLIVLMVLGLGLIF
jgi:chromate transporter